MKCICGVFSYNMLGSEFVGVWSTCLLGVTVRWLGPYLSVVWQAGKGPGGWIGW